METLGTVGKWEFPRIEDPKDPCKALLFGNSQIGFRDLGYIGDM